MVNGNKKKMMRFIHRIVTCSSSLVLIYTVANNRFYDNLKTIIASCIQNTTNNKKYKLCICIYEMQIKEEINTGKQYNNRIL